MPAYYLEFCVVGLGLILLLLDAFVPGKDKRWLGILGIFGLASVYFMMFSAKGGQPVPNEPSYWDFFTFGEQTFAGFFKGIALITTMIVILMGVNYLKVIKKYTDQNFGAGEFFILPIFTCAGLMWTAGATDLISIFVSIELVSISFYVLVSFLRRNTGSLEAGVKYLILGALSTGFLVYGITWTFGVTGETNLVEIQKVLEAGEVNGLAVLFAFILLIVAFGFKVGAYPFNVWIPDVYQGAPTPITAFLSVGSKAAGFIVLLRLMEPFYAAQSTIGSSGMLVGDAVRLIMAILAGLTMLFGNLVAILQTNFKRLLAYSSISHAGFLLLAIACAPNDLATIAPANAISLNLSSYMMMTLLAFFVVSIVRAQLGTEELDGFNGLSRRSPFLAFALTISVVALAGIPLTSGFFGKFFVFRITVQAEEWVLLGIALFAAAAGFYYYFKIIRAMYLNPGPEITDETPKISVPFGARMVMVALIAAIIIFGVNPKPLLNLKEGAAITTTTEKPAH